MENFSVINCNFKESTVQNNYYTSALFGYMYSDALCVYLKNTTIGGTLVSKYGGNSYTSAFFMTSASSVFSYYIIDCQFVVEFSNPGICTMMETSPSYNSA